MGFFNSTSITPGILFPFSPSVCSLLKPDIVLSVMSYSIYLSIRHFRHFLEGCEFYVLTDHKPLTHALSSLSSHYSPRETRHLDFISQFTSDIRHVHGTDNPVADALSRMDINALNAPFDPTPPLDYNLITQAQLNDSDLSQLKSTSWHLQALPLPFSTGTILWDMTIASPRPYIPATFRRLVFDQFHNPSHPGIHATQCLITERFVWPGINTDIRQWTKSCLPCQRAKVQRHTVTPLGTVTTPDARLITFTLILSVLFLHLKAVVICSLALIVSPGGPKPYLSQTSLPKLLLALFLRIGYLPLVSHPLLQLTAVRNLNHPSSQPLQTFSEPNGYAQLHITHVPMEWLSVSTVN